MTLDGTLHPLCLGFPVHKMELTALAGEGVLGRFLGTRPGAGLEGRVQYSMHLLTCEALRPAWRAGAVTAMRPLPLGVRAKTEVRKPAGALVSSLEKVGIRDGGCEQGWQKEGRPGRGHGWSRGWGGVGEHDGWGWGGVGSRR